MGVPLSQMWTVARHVVGKRLTGQSRYALVLMLEPLFRCNLACAGCGKIQYPAEVLRRHLSPEDCWRAADECGAPIVAIPGGEPLLHPQIDAVVAGLVARKKYVYLCTNAIRLEESLDRFTPSKHLSFSVHMDGPREEHDQAVCRDGVYDVAVSAIRAALARGFRVTTNTTLYDGVDPARMRQFFDDMMALGVEGMMVSPGYRYEMAPDQEHFLGRTRTITAFRQLLDRPKRGWRFNLSPIFMEFLCGNVDLECTPWGSPTYNLFGWQRPCYLQNESYAATYQELLDTTDWSRYGHHSGNPKCADCMMHCGFEPTAVAETLGTLRGLLTAARVTLFGSKRGSPRVAAARVAPPAPPSPSPPRETLVQLSTPRPASVADESQTPTLSAR